MTARPSPPPADSASDATVSDGPQAALVEQSAAVAGLPERFGRYPVLKKLGEGGMGTVYLAKDAVLDRLVALKVFTSRERIREEARAVAQITHPNICRVYDLDLSSTPPFMTMQYVEGGTLAQFLKERGTLPTTEAALVVQQLAQAMKVAHEAGVLHRDLKPGNILRQPTGELVIADFGLARVVGDPGKTLPGTIFGTPHYMPPEQACGDVEHIGPASDVYSLGVILYELLTGRTPFQGSNSKVIAEVLCAEPPRPRSLNRNVDSRLEALCLKALAKEPMARYASMGAFATELGAYLSAKRDSPSETDPATRSGSTPRRSWVVAAGLAALGTVLTLVLLEWPEKDNPNGTLKTERARIELPKATLTVLPSPSGSQPPARAQAPFDEKSAKALQQAWAKFLGRMVEEDYDLGDGVKLTMVLIPPGTFTMGSSPEEKRYLRQHFGAGYGDWADQEEQREVTITKPFYLGKFEITQEQFKRLLVKQEPCWFSAEGGGKAAVRGRDTRRFPVEHLSWEEAVAYCQALSRSLRRKADLPSEAEWEYACRAGSVTAFHFGDRGNGTEANCNGFKPYGTNQRGHYHGRTEEVGSYAKYANAFGLFDMHGNVWEWCADYYGPYRDLPLTDPLKAEKALEHVLRGGSWSCGADCRAALRGKAERRWVPGDVGFRVAFRLD